MKFVQSWFSRGLLGGAIILALISPEIHAAEEAIALNSSRQEDPTQMYVGTDPYRHARKLQALAQGEEIDPDEAVKILDKAELFLLCPTFRFYNGHIFLKRAAKKYEGAKRSFPKKKLIHMMAAALNFDNVIFIPTTLGLMAGGYYCVSASASRNAVQSLKNNYTNTVNFTDIDYLLSNATSNTTNYTLPCSICDEEWNTDIPINVSDPRNIQVGNVTLFYAPFGNEPHCRGVLEKAKEYILLAVENVTWNPHSKGQAFNTYKLNSDGNFTVYNVYGAWGHLEGALTLQCNFDRALDVIDYTVNELPTLIASMTSTVAVVGHILLKKYFE